VRKVVWGAALLCAAALPTAAQAKTRPCHVPNVVGRTVPAAKRMLRADGCAVGRIVSGALSTGKVATQNPRAGRKLPYGSMVNITLGRKPAPAPSATTLEVFVTAGVTDANLNTPFTVTPDVLDKNGAIIPSATVALTFTDTTTGVVLGSYPTNVPCMIEQSFGYVSGGSEIRILSGCGIGAEVGLYDTIQISASYAGSPGQYQQSTDTRLF
jgi:hypothetical protein